MHPRDPSVPERTATLGATFSTNPMENPGDKPGDSPAPAAGNGITRGLLNL